MTPLVWTVLLICNLYFSKSVVHAKVPVEGEPKLDDCEEEMSKFNVTVSIEPLAGHLDRRD